MRQSYTLWLTTGRQCASWVALCTNRKPNAVANKTAWMWLVGSLPSYFPWFYLFCFERSQPFPSVLYVILPDGYVKYFFFDLGNIQSSFCAWKRTSEICWTISLCLLKWILLKRKCADLIKKGPELDSKADPPLVCLLFCHLLFPLLLLGNGRACCCQLRWTENKETCQKNESRTCECVSDCVCFQWSWWG